MCCFKMGLMIQSFRRDSESQQIMFDAKGTTPPHSSSLCRPRMRGAQSWSNQRRFVHNIFLILFGCTFRPESVIWPQGPSLLTHRPPGKNLYSAFGKQHVQARNQLAMNYRTVAQDDYFLQNECPALYGFSCLPGGTTSAA